jgi:WD40 repeat protein/tetratricopeptide (TPR) repeat protein/tRNA A-37 threonylcarbamoyl transferase component Bud32
MNPPPSASRHPSDPAVGERERRRDLVIASYLEAVRSGRPTDRSNLLAIHADLADDLLSFFADEDRLKALAGRLLPRDNPDDSPHLAFASGTDFGEYELIEEIASGGMGVVFKARQKKLDRIVALKTIRPAALRPGADAIQRFRIEAEAVARLDHPHIVPIYEMGDLGGFPFLCLKLIVGHDLEWHVSRLVDDPRAIARLMNKVARAIHYAHLRGVLHRDLKPSNILLDDEDEPHVTDFGLAKCIENESGLTHTGLILGTPSYMAPEQVSGLRGEITTAADVYGLGAVLYKLLSGRPPFQADSVYETLRQVREQEPVPPGARGRRVDRDLEAICLKSLDKDPRRRYPSAESLAADLERWLSGEPITARPIGPAERAWRWCRQNPVVAGLSTAVAGLLLTVAIVASVAAVRQKTLAEHERDARLLADDRAEEIRWRLVRMNVDNGVRLMDQGDYAGALPWFAEALLLDGKDPRAAWSHRLRLATLLNQAPVLVGALGHARTINWATFDRSGRRIATGSADGTARIWDAATGALISPALAHDGPVNWVEFQGDGARLLTASDDETIRIWDADDGRPDGAQKLVHGSPVRLARFSPDGRWIASAGFNGTVRIWDARKGTTSGTPLRSGNELFCLEFSPDGQILAAGSSDGTVRLWRLAAESVRSLGKLSHRGAIRGIAFSPDGHRLVTASQDGTAQVWDAHSRTTIGAPLPHGRWVFHAEFSPDGGRVVTASHDGTARVWDARTGRPITPLAGPMGHSVGVRHASFSPDGGRIATAGYDGTARVWDAATGEPLSPPLYHGSMLIRARFSADGSRVLTVGSDPTARLWNLSTLGSSAIIVELAAGANHVAFHPGGQSFATASTDGTARVWDGITGQPVTPPLVHRRGVTRLAFTKDGSRLATGCEDGTARIWNARTGEPASPALAHEGAVRCLRFSPDGSRLATASADHKARVWDVATGRASTPSLPHDHEVLDLAFSADGRMLATASQDRTARLWDARTGSPLIPPIRHDAPVASVAFHPDRPLLLTACSDASFAERQAQQWDLATGRPEGPPLKHGDGVLGASYSPDGRTIATASEDRTARLWDSSTGRPLTPPLRHQHQVLMLEFSPDGRMLATCGLDGSARLWDVATGEPLSPPLTHQGQIRVGCVSFRPDGRALATAGQDGTVRIWDLSPVDRPALTLSREAQVRAGRRIDPTAGQVTLDADDLSTAWEHLMKDRPSSRSTPPAPGIQAAWHRREARRLESKRQGGSAAWHLSRLAELEPNDRAIPARLAAAYEISADWENVEATAARAIAANARDVDSRIRRGWSQIHLGRPVEAAADFRAALDQEAESAPIRVGLFVALAELERTTDANRIWSSLINDDDETRVDRWNSMSAHLTRLTENRSECWWFWRARGQVRKRLVHPDQAEADFGEAIHLNPKDGWSYLGRGLVRKSRGSIEPALSDLSRSVELEPNVSTAWGHRGELNGLQGRWNQAASDFARWYALGGDPLPVPLYFHALLRLYANDPPGYRRACMTMWERFRTTSDPFAAALLAHACSLAPDCGVNPDRVLEFAQKATRDKPKDSWTLFTLASALRRANQPELALAKLEEAMKVDPNWPGTPLIAALRELTTQALTAHSGIQTHPDGRPQGNLESPMSSSQLQARIKKLNAAWQYQVEANLLGRELDTIRSAETGDVILDTVSDPDKGEPPFDTPR